MNTFLENITDEIISKYKENISKICIIFPSRRAGLYFKNILGRKIEKPIWSPSIFSIEDFIEKFSTYNLVDNFKLLFELYSVYKDIVNTEKIIRKDKIDYVEEEYVESFDSFYSWGEMLLKDFEIIDKYIINTGLLFKGIKNIKEIEEDFPLELQEDFKRFWGTIISSKQTDTKENFLKIWEIIGKVYLELTNRLKKSGICYAGMAYRKIYEELEKIINNLKWEKIIFAGFNSLNTVEKQLMKMLIEKGIADVYWDIDDYYISDENQEAGYFLRKNIKDLSGKVKLEKYFTSEVKKINVIGTSSFVGMAKVLGNELTEYFKDIDFNIERTAIILPDAKMLLPVLYSIPEKIKSINITMGFPFIDTSLYNLISLLIDLQSNYICENGMVKFYYSDIKKILLHPYIKFHNTFLVFDILVHIEKNNLVYLNFKDYPLETPKFIEIIFDKIETVNEAMNYLSNIIGLISSRIENDESKDSDYKKFQLEYIYSFLLSFSKLNDAINENEVEMNLETYWKVLKSVLQKISIPFTGEPLKGLQIMGLLETRALDFENVFVLSANEGVLPEGRMNKKSFIPYSLRKAFKLPTYEDEDSITSYYFYRLIQRAKNIFLIYNTDIGDEVKEKSRYIMQIENELLPRNKNITYHHKIVLSDLYNFNRKNIEIVKNDVVQRKILNINYYSPSTLIKYINCPLQFYFSNIADIQEEDEVVESFNSQIIGNILHKILELIYKPYKEKVIDEKKIEEIELKIRKSYDEIFEVAVCENNCEFLLKEYEGRDRLFKDIVYKLLVRVIENEKMYIPFKIIDTEKKIESLFNFNLMGKEFNVKISGRIDRIDEKNGITRIIDYKTGSFKLNKYDEKNSSLYFDKLILDPEFKENFQAFFYGYFYAKDNTDKKINVGIYPIKKISDGIREIKNDFVSKEEFNLFENSLKKLFSEIHNPEITFKQVEDESRCEYCPYSKLCYRDLNNTI